MISRRALLAAAVASSAALTRRASAQAYPSRVIKMIVPSPPAGRPTPWRGSPGAKARSS